MILKFIQAESKQAILFMSDAIASVAPGPADGTSYVLTKAGVAYVVLGTPEQIQASLWSEVGMSTVAIAPVGG